jgi:hypothetical protein
MKTPAHWFRARYRGICKTPGCRCQIRSGDLVFCPPSSKAVKCQACGEMAGKLSKPQLQHS